MTTKTTAHLITSWRQRLRHFFRRQDPWLLIALTLLALPLVSAGIQSLVSAFSRPYQSIIIVATPPLPSPAVTPSVPSPPVATPAYQIAMSAPLRTGACAVIAYGAPSLDTQIGAIEPARPYTPTTRIDDEWLQAEVAGSGVIWLRVIDLACLGGVPDIATPAPPAAPAPAVLLAAPLPAQPTVAPPTPVPPPTPAPHLLPTPMSTPWDSEAAREAEREVERRAWESVDDMVPTKEEAP